MPIRRCIMMTLAIAAFLAGGAVGSKSFEDLKPEGTYHGFAVENLYVDFRDEAVGARVVHARTGFTIDLFQLQTAPQAFLWVNTPNYSDMGEPHACEHLLLGKGTKGRYVGNLEDMALGRSTAWTSQQYTCYPFNSGAGMDVFYLLLLKKLDALIYPTFSDEEILREAYYVGADLDQATNEIRLDEKATIYAEMLSYAEKYWNYFFDEANRMVYGPGHPKSANAGGTPEALRKMTPADMRRFHERCYQLDNMGMIVAFPENETLAAFLDRVDGILTELNKSGEVRPRRVNSLPVPKPAGQMGEIRLTTYPGANPQDPGYVSFAWPADLQLTLKEKFLLDQFLEAFANGESSNLYNAFVNSQTRVMDIGANEAWGGADDDTGYSISIGLNNVTPENITRTQLLAIRKAIQDELKILAAYGPESGELKDFNARVTGNMIEGRKGARNMLNSPPGFGLRLGSGNWYYVVELLEKRPGYRKSLSSEELYDFALAEIAKNENIWAPLIEKCRLLAVEPYAIGCKADPSMQEKAAAEKEIRMQAYSQKLMQDLKTDNIQSALALYKEDLDRRTEEIDKAMTTVEMPKFISNPPMSYDPVLDYRVTKVAGNVPLVIADFKNITSTTLGLALSLKAIPEDKLIYVPLLPDLIRDLGVVRDGETIDYTKLDQRLQQEILSLNATLTSNPNTDRFELMITGAGNSPEENKQLLGWIQAGLFSPYLEPDNLSRIRDVVVNKLTALRKRTQTYEEYWVAEPTTGYRYQHKPLLLASGCFLAQEHLMHRLKWRLKDSGNPQDEQMISDLFSQLGSAAEKRTKVELVSFAADFARSDPSRFEGGPFASFVDAYTAAPAEVQDILGEAVADLAAIMPTIPEDNAASDWAYLAGQMSNDLKFRPEKALEEIKQTLALVRNQSLARMYIVSNPQDCDALLPQITALINQLDQKKPTFAQYSVQPTILTRMKSRYPGLEKPIYAGLVNADSRNGVFLFSAPCADLKTTDEKSLLDFVAAQLYSGGGNHSMLMKTWGAGLAYSNGFGVNELNGRLSYYAERCPDLSATMRFVVNELENIPFDTSLAEYAVAQLFIGGRTANSYQSRGASMAANLADGVTPEMVSNFRRQMLNLRQRKNFYELLHNRLPQVYGQVLIGYGPPLAKVNEGIYFIIGPEEQFASLKKYIAETEGEQEIYKIYPRDYWLVH